MNRIRLYSNGRSRAVLLALGLPLLLTACAHRGPADEVAALACWLASEECSFSTGATFDVSGGRAVF